MENSLFGRRNVSIDMLRGLTMLLMVFVNDLWTVGGVPHSLEHFERFEDGMGLSDIVFPMFLFAMGMSIPYAIERRFSKGFSGESTLGHILSRTLALSAGPRIIWLGRLVPSGRCLRHRDPDGLHDAVRPVQHIRFLRAVYL